MKQIFRLGLRNQREAHFLDWVISCTNTASSRVLNPYEQDWFWLLSGPYPEDGVQETPSKEKEKIQTEDQVDAYIHDYGRK